jgi:transcriptional regulator with XRE-family HTH domain
MNEILARIDQAITALYGGGHGRVAKFARESGMAASTIYAWYRDDTAPSARHVPKIAACTGIPADWFLAGPAGCSHEALAVVEKKLNLEPFALIGEVAPRRNDKTAKVDAHAIRAGGVPNMPFVYTEGENEYTCVPSDNAKVGDLVLCVDDDFAVVGFLLKGKSLIHPIDGGELRHVPKGARLIKIVGRWTNFTKK